MATTGHYLTYTQVASSVPFDNSTNGFIATDVQAAIEEVETAAFEATATADTTTTSSSDVLIGSMTLTPAAGNYLVQGSLCVDHSAQSVAVVVSIYVGGSLETSSVRSVVPRFNGIGANSLSPCVSTHGIVTVNGSQAIELRWKTASGTATAHQRVLTVLRTT